jgi:hypothetical protein
MIHTKYQRPNPKSKTQQRKREERTRHPVTVVVCAQCGHTDAPLKKDGNRYICTRCAEKHAGA